MQWLPSTFRSGWALQWEKGERDVSLDKRSGSSLQNGKRPKKRMVGTH
jgi:hypothetical protein